MLGFFSFQGLLGRVYETVIILFLLIIVVIGLAWVASAIFEEDDHHSKETLFGRLLCVGQFGDVHQQNANCLIYIFNKQWYFC